MQRQLITTADGSVSLYVPALDETYHSTYGALGESEHIFIQTALRQHHSKRLTVFEVGFGTGLNALLTWRETQNRDVQVDYWTVERYPLTPDEVGMLTYPLDREEQAVFAQLHTSPADTWVTVSPSFRINKQLVDFTQWSMPPQSVDIIYFDAFSPDKQPEMWTEQRFAMLYDACRPGAILATYCAKGVLRRRMQAVGFSVERLPDSPNGKREILRARK